MQAKPNHLPIPTKFLPPLNPSPATGISLPQTKTPQAISITTSPNHIPTLSTSQSDDMVAAFWDYQFLFVSQRSETPNPITLRVVDGAIPPDFPSGTYYLTGPGLFKDDHGSTVHPLDGHGYLRAFTINGATKDVQYMAKYVKTEAQLEEHDPLTNKWKFTHRGPFSVLKGGRKIGNTKVMKNVANTSVVSWGGKLLCLWEGGDPYEIESSKLDTIGKLDMINGRDEIVDGKNNGSNLWDVAAKLLKPILHGVFKMPPKRLLSHYKIDGVRNRLLTVSCNAEDMLLPNSYFTFYEFDSKLKMIHKREFNIEDHMMIHDWAFTDTHYILFANRITLDIPGSMTAVCGLSPMITALKVNPSKSTSPIYLLPRFDDESFNNGKWKVPIEAPSQMWLLHAGNAFEKRDEHGNLDIQIHASACSYQWFNFQSLFGYDWKSGKLDPSAMNMKEEEKHLLPHLVQVSIKIAANGNYQKCIIEPFNQWSNTSDFPVINPAFSGNENTYIYAATTSGSRQALPHFPFDMVVKLNVLNGSVQTWSVGTRRFIGEPIFVPKGDQEDDGYVLVVEYAVAIQRCYLVVLDPKKIGEGDAAVARLEVPKNLNFPLGFHGFWASQL